MQEILLDFPDIGLALIQCDLGIYTLKAGADRDTRVERIKRVGNSGDVPFIGHVDFIQQPFFYGKQFADAVQRLKNAEAELLAAKRGLYVQINSSNAIPEELAWVIRSHLKTIQPSELEARVKGQ